MEQSKKKKMKKILFLSGKWADLGGLNKMISIISSSLSSEYEVLVGSMDISKPGEGYALNKNVKYLEFQPSELYNLPKILVDLNVDVLIGSNNCDKPYLNLYKELKNTNVKSIMWNHEFYFLPFIQKNLWEIALFRREIFQYPDAVVWLTDTSTRICRQYSKRVVTIGNCVADKSYSPNTEKSLRIISMGRFDSKQKGIGFLLCMFAELLKLNSNAYLYIVGKYDLSLRYSDSCTETVQQLLNRLKLPADKLKFTGEVKDVYQFLKRSSVNVMTSEMEGFGLTILEAAKCGIPSVIFSGGGSSDIIVDGVNGCVVKYGDSIGMAKRINDLFNNKILYQRMKNEMQKFVNSYSLQTIKSKWVDLLETVCSGKDIENKENLSPETERFISFYEYSLLRNIKSQGSFKEYDSFVSPNSLPARSHSKSKILTKIQKSIIKEGYRKTAKRISLYILDKFKEKIAKN